VNETAGASATARFEKMTRDLNRAVVEVLPGAPISHVRGAVVHGVSALQRLGLRRLGQIVDDKLYG
jgi:hypothetical protein